jgi:YD repeat-containing protein
MGDERGNEVGETVGRMTYDGERRMTYDGERRRTR